MLRPLSFSTVRYRDTPRLHFPSLYQRSNKIFRLTSLSSLRFLCSRKKQDTQDMPSYADLRLPEARELNFKLEEAIFKLKNPSLAQQLFEKSFENSIPRNERTYFLIINLWAQDSKTYKIHGYNGDLNRIHRAIKLMERDGLRLDTWTLNKELLAHNTVSDDNERTTILMETFERYTQMGIKPDIYTYNYLLFSLWEIRPTMACHLFEELISRGIEPNRSVTCLVLQACMASDNPELARSIWNKYKDTFPLNNDVTNNVCFTYLRCMCELLQKSDAEEVFELIKTRGFINDEQIRQLSILYARRFDIQKIEQLYLSLKVNYPRSMEAVDAGRFILYSHLPDVSKIEQLISTSKALPKHWQLQWFLVSLVNQKEWNKIPGVIESIKSLRQPLHSSSLVALMEFFEEINPTISSVELLKTAILFTNLSDSRVLNLMLKLYLSYDDPRFLEKTKKLVKYFEETRSPLYKSQLSFPLAIFSKYGDLESLESISSRLHPDQYQDQKLLSASKIRYHGLFLNDFVTARQEFTMFKVKSMKNKDVINDVLFAFLEVCVKHKRGEDGKRAIAWVKLFPYPNYSWDFYELAFDVLIQGGKLEESYHYLQELSKKYQGLSNHTFTKFIHQILGALIEKRKLSDYLVSLYGRTKNHKLVVLSEKELRLAIDQLNIF